MVAQTSSPGNDNPMEEESGDEEESAFPSFVSPYPSQDDVSVSLKSEPLDHIAPTVEEDLMPSPSARGHRDGDFFAGSGNLSPPTTVLAVEDPPPPVYPDTLKRETDF